jgi:hypothetical protein
LICQWMGVASNKCHLQHMFHTVQLHDLHFPMKPCTTSCQTPVCTSSRLLLVL